MPIYENFPSKEAAASVNQDGLMSKADKVKLDGIESGANKYVHPDDTNTRHVSDDEKTQWSENTVFTNETPTVISVGGISAGTTFENMPVKEILNKLFYPYVAPVVSCSSSPNGGVYERGTSVAVSQITVSITKKSENITKVEIFDGSESLGSRQDGQVGNVVFALTDKSVTEDKSFTAKVTDASNKTVSATSGRFTFIHPYYQGVIEDNAEINETLIKGLTKLVQTKSSKTLTFTTARGATKILKVVSFSSRRIWNFSPLSLARISGALARTSDKGATNQCSSSPERISEESGIPSLL